MRKTPLVLLPTLLLLCTDALAEGPSQWTPIAPLPQPRNQAIAVAGLNGDIYIMDGWLAGNVMTSSLIRYNVLTDDYTTLANAPTGARGPCAAALSDGTIVLFDGFEDTMPTTRTRPTSTIQIKTSGSSSYFNNTQPYFDSVWLYDTVNDPNGVVLPAGRRNPVSGVSGNTIYVFGGATNASEEEA